MVSATWANSCMEAAISSVAAACRSPKETVLSILSIIVLVCDAIPDIIYV